MARKNYIPKTCTSAKNITTITMQIAQSVYSLTSIPDFIGSNPPLKYIVKMVTSDQWLPKTKWRPKKMSDMLGCII